MNIRACTRAVACRQTVFRPVTCTLRNFATRAQEDEQMEAQKQEQRNMERGKLANFMDDPAGPARKKRDPEEAVQKTGMGRPLVSSMSDHPQAVEDEADHDKAWTQFSKDAKAGSSAFWAETANKMEKKGSKTEESDRGQKGFWAEPDNQGKSKMGSYDRQKRGFAKMPMDPEMDEAARREAILAEEEGESAAEQKSSHKIHKLADKDKLSKGKGLERRSSQKHPQAEPETAAQEDEAHDTAKRTTGMKKPSSGKA